MNRRKFLSRGAAAGLMATPLAGLASTWQQQFHAGLEQHPWLYGYATAEQDQYKADVAFTGRWPERLTGTLFRNGPARHEIGDFRYRHWFAGDGMVHAYQVTPQGLKHQAKFVQTYKHVAETEAGRALYPGFASAPPDPLPVTSPDTINPANISVLHHHGKLLALWEAGSPWEIDAETLDTKGVYAFEDYTRGVPFSAHPRVEADGTLWNFGYLSQANLLVLWHIDASGKLKQIEKVAVDPITMVHDFVVTSKHIVIVLPPYHYEGEGAENFLDAHVWYPEQATRVLVVDKNDFSQQQWYELPAQWIFHFGNGWEDEAGVIRFDAARTDNPLVMVDTFRDLMSGKLTGATPSQHHHYQIDTKAKRISEAPMFGPFMDTEFPSVDPRVSCRQNQRLCLLSHDQSKPAAHINLNEVSMYSYQGDELQSFRYPDAEIPEEHIYVPDLEQPAERGGWVIGTALNWQTKQTKLNLFNADHVADGPIATATLPYGIPLGLHGKFVHG